MIHIVVFGYIFVILVGIICLTVALFLYHKIRDRLLYHFLVYFSAFTLFIFFYLLVLTYINAIDVDIGFYFILSLLAIIIVCYSFLIYSILNFGHYLVNKKPSIKRKSFEILVSITSLIGIVTSFRIDWANNQINQRINFGLIFSYALFLFVIIYILLLKLYNRKKVDEERRQIYMRTSIMNIIFIPGVLVDFYLLKTLHFSLFIPLFYICYSILFIQYFIEKYYADLISGSSPEDINELNNYLNQAGISVREKEIITLIMKGHSNKKISDQLFISLSTVKTHIRNIFQKLNVESRFEIISRINNNPPNLV